MRGGPARLSLGFVGCCLSLQLVYLRLPVHRRAHRDTVVHLCVVRLGVSLALLAGRVGAVAVTRGRPPATTVPDAAAGVGHQGQAAQGQAQG